jgi:hypothetical protein
MSDLTDTIRLIAKAGAGNRQATLDHYKSVLLEAQRDADWQDLLKADPSYIEWANRIDSQEGK